MPTREEEGRFWIELREPRRIPERKGSWPTTMLARTLRDFMAARPTAYITVITIVAGEPVLSDGPETLVMLDGRSKATADRNLSNRREAHGDHAALREGHLEGDAVAGAEEDWQPIADVPPGTDKIIGWCVFPAGAEARMCQRFYRDDRWMAFGIAQSPTHFKPWPAEGPSEGGAGGR